MAKTPEERAQISRDNGRKSNGPKTLRGKMASRCNALKHGCRSQILLMPDESPEEIAGLFASWRGYYRPQSPAAEHLLDLCVRAKLMSDRAFTAHDSAVADQVEEAIEAFDAARAAMVAEQEDLLA